MRGAMILLGGLAAAAAAVACESLIGVDYGDQHLATCDYAEPPAAPSGSDTGDTIGFTAAIYTIDWGDTDDAQGNPRALSIGYDLDHQCTSLDAPLCEPASWTGATVTDGPGGIDNAIGMLLYDQGSAFGLKPFTSSFLTQSTQDGTQAPPGIVRVSEYSGFSVDPQVTVEWSVPLAPGTKPKWDGTDSWPILHGTADATGGSGVVSHYIDHAAYVTGYQLVAHFPSGAPLVVSNVPIQTTTMLITANLSQPVQGQWEMQNGIVAGVGMASELFHDVAAMSVSFAGANDAGKPNAICKNDTALYPKIKTWFCSHFDTTLSGGSTCDAASFGMSFTARAGNVGAIAPATTPVVYCAPGDDPTGDTCATPP